MMRLIYSDLSLNDIEGIVHYIGRDNPPAAMRFGEGILDTCRLLETNPELGVQRKDLGQGLRLFTYRGYGIYYRIDRAKQAVLIERVLHPALDVRHQSFD